MRRRVAAAWVGRLATVAPDGRPRIVPCTFALVGSVVYSAVDDKPKRTAELARLTDIEANPLAALLVDEYDDDWSQLWWVRLRGGARVLRGGDEREDALDALARRYAQYAERRPSGPVVALDVDEWRGWSSA